MKKIYTFILILILLFILSQEVFSLTIKLGSLAPAGSAWDKLLKELALEWKKISKGKVIIKIYPGGIAGDEPAMIRKMRLRQLHAAAITSVGMNQIAVGPLSMSAPLFIRTDEELEYILEKATPFFDEDMEQKGFISVMWTFAGWTYFFGRKPIYNPEDLRKQKLWVWDSTPKIIEVWKKAGYNPIPLAVPDLLTSLQSGMTDALLASPLSTAAYQWFAIAKYMCDLKFAPLIAGIIISKSTWEKIPEDIRPELLASAHAIGKRISGETRRSDAEAIEIMKQYGLEVCEIPKDEYVNWYNILQEYFDELIEADFGKEAYEMVKSHLEEFRKNEKSQK
ncbi:MAG: TRAP transporter substrate-binding protein DctP [Spirochaetales bacterium]|nr:TRAP transporter substrate-binding protein DctP [Spirochaetales bacterium]